ncbi:adenosinetriphosphatase [Plasmodium inui San Antonio 1]|uniref:Adenosinetriphosphatase n=1 Tax=Plasmodium inui San Antonio 1 TaxID=1237626 RepID=W7A5L2_9APIC|nr:adenosinetriphosphatase [Plasmodium inui San Antonio 1]EUD67025.1 adenosinetriphosphatase [Plasmodium inui San Antonio 1]
MNSITFDNVLHAKSYRLNLDDIQNLGSLYSSENNKKIAKYNEEIDLLKEQLNYLNEKMGKCGHVHKVMEPAKPSELTFWCYELKEMKEFQDLVMYEIKKKKKHFKILSQSCVKYLSNREKIKQKKQEEEEKRLKTHSKHISSYMDMFWKKIEKLVWEEKKRELQKTLNKKKEMRFKRFVKDAIKKIKRARQGNVHELFVNRHSSVSSCNPSENVTFSSHQDPTGGSNDRSSVASSKRLSRLSSEGVSRRSSRRSRRRVSAGNLEMSTARGSPNNTEGGDVQNLADDELKEEDLTNQEEEDVLLDEQMDSSDESEEKEKEINLLDDEANMPIEELLKRIYGFKSGEEYLDLMQDGGGTADEEVEEADEEDAAEGGTAEEGEPGDDEGDHHERDHRQPVESKANEKKRKFEEVEEAAPPGEGDVKKKSDSCVEGRRKKRRSRSRSSHSRRRHSGRDNHTGTDKDNGGEQSDSSVSSTSNDDTLMCNMDEKHLTKIPPFIKATLRDYQHAGLHWLLYLYKNNINGILADEMGLGKTLQCISLLSYLAYHFNIWGPHLIIVPTSILINWEIELKRFSPCFKILSYFGNQNERYRKRIGWFNKDSFHVCISSYSTIVKDHMIFKRKRWKYIILDEAHNIKNFNTKRWNIILSLKRENCLLVTGTPLQNSLEELWSLLHFLMPNIFTSHLDFKEWFSDPLNLAIQRSKINDSRELIDRLHTVIRPYILRRLKKNVEKEMPNKYEHIIKCKLTRRQQVLYDEFIQNKQVQNTLSSGNYIGLMNILIQLRKVCNHCDLFTNKHIQTPYYYLLPITFYIPRFCILFEKTYHLDFHLILFLHKEFTSLGGVPPHREAAGKRISKDHSDRKRDNLITVLPTDPLGSFSHVLAAPSEGNPPFGVIPPSEQSTWGLSTFQSMQRIIPQEGPNKGYTTSSSTDNRIDIIPFQALPNGGKTTLLPPPHRDNTVDESQMRHPLANPHEETTTGPYSPPQVICPFQRSSSSTGTVITSGKKRARAPSGEITMKVNYPPNGMNTGVTSPDKIENLFPVHLRPDGGGAPTINIEDVNTYVNNQINRRSVPRNLLTYSDEFLCEMNNNYDIMSLFIDPGNKHRCYDEYLYRTVKDVSPCGVATGGRDHLNKATSHKHPTSEVATNRCRNFLYKYNMKVINTDTQYRNFFTDESDQSYVNSLEHNLWIKRQRRFEEKDRRREEQLKESFFNEYNLLKNNRTPLFGTNLLSLLRREFSGDGFVPYHSSNNLPVEFSPMRGVRAMAVKDASEAVDSTAATHAVHLSGVAATHASGSAALETLFPTMELFLKSHQREIHNFTVLNTPAVICSSHRIAVNNNLLQNCSHIEPILHRIKVATRVYHEPFHKQSIIFPLNKDITLGSGKLFALEKLLNKCKREGNKCLLFTQFIKMLDILEIFLNHLNYTFIRLDGSTKVEQRQKIVTKFNNDKSIFLFISSTRSGSIGINLTAANVVIFYDTDWNPSIDKQAMDRCHRIGQTKDVHVFRFVSEYTVEENIWKKQLQKRKLDTICISMGNFSNLNNESLLQGGRGRASLSGEKNNPSSEREDSHRNVPPSIADVLNGGGNTMQNKDSQTKDWFANADTIKEIFVNKRNNDEDEDIYKDRLLHEHMDESEKTNVRFEKTLEHVEDKDDINALHENKKETLNAISQDLQEFTNRNDFQDTYTLTSYCFNFLNDNLTDSLKQQIDEMKMKIEIEMMNVGEEEDDDEDGEDDEEDEDNRDDEDNQDNHRDDDDDPTLDEASPSSSTETDGLHGE